MRRFTTLAFLLLAALLVSLPTLAQDIITTAIGGGPNGIPAIDADLYNPYGVAVDSSGNFYIASFNQNRVFKVTASTGVISVVAGSGSQGYTGDGVVGGAANASLYHPFAVAVDSGLNVYIADQYNCVIRKVTTANTITTIAGIAGSCGYSGDTGKGTAAEIYYPQGVGVDSSGDLYIGDYNNCVVRKAGSVDQHHHDLRRQPHLRLQRRQRRGHQRGIELRRGSGSRQHWKPIYRGPGQLRDPRSHQVHGQNQHGSRKPHLRLFGRRWRGDFGGIEPDVRYSGQRHNRYRC